MDCCCVREGWHFWNKNWDGADVAAEHGVRIRGRNGWVLPPGWEGRVDVSITHPDLPKWIRIGKEYDGYDFELVHIRPLVYRCVRSSGDRWSRPGADDVLWLFEKGNCWVAGHADKEAKQIQDVLDEAQEHLVWSTRVQCPWTEGYHEWMWADNDASHVALGALVVGRPGTFRTRRL